MRRHLKVWVFVLVSFAGTVSAACTCVQQAVQSSQCSGANDFACLCQSEYLFNLQSCFAFSDDPSCNSNQQSAAENRFNKGCNAVTSAAESTTESDFPTDTASATPSDSGSDSATATPTSTDESSTTDLPTPTASTSSPGGVVVVTGAPVAGGGSSTSSGSGGSKPALSKGAIGGVVGASVAAVAIGIGVAVFLLTRRYRKKDAIVAETNAKEIENFIEEGRRKPSAALSASSPSSRAPSGSYGERTPLSPTARGGARSASGRTFSMDGPVPEESYEEPPSPPQLPPPPIGQGTPEWSNVPPPGQRSAEVQPLSPGSYDRQQQMQEVHSPMSSFHPQGYY